MAGSDAVAAQFPGERRVTAGVTQRGDLAVQAGAAQMGVVAGALADVAGERRKVTGVRAGLPGCPQAVEVDADGLAFVLEVAGDL